MIYKAGCFSKHIWKFVYSMQTADQARQTLTWNLEILEAVFQSSSTSLNQTHMSVGVLHREEKHEKN